MADANEATAVQIAAHSPSDNASTTVSAARLVSPSIAPCGDQSNGSGSSQKLRRSAERAGSNPVLLPIGPTFGLRPSACPTVGARHLNLVPPAVVCHLNPTVVSPVSGTASKSGLSFFDRSYGSKRWQEGQSRLIQGEAIPPCTDLRHSRLVPLRRQTEAERSFGRKHIDQYERRNL